MARIHIDVSAFGEQWFKECYEELMTSANVRFSYSPSKQFNSEHERTKKAKEFYKLVGDLNKRDDADPSDVEQKMDFLSSKQTWRNERDCDDPHIFALVYVLPTKFIFTSDRDIANCRKHINRTVENRYCNFRLICDKKNYQSHKHQIFS